jgi:hypothetical protein
MFHIVPKKKNHHLKQKDCDIYLFIKIMKLLYNIFILLLFLGSMKHLFSWPHTFFFKVIVDSPSIPLFPKISPLSSL